MNAGVESGTFCGGSLVATNVSQTLSSPGYPNNYENNLNCLWTITAPWGFYVTIQIYDMDTETGYDFLYIVEGRADLWIKLVMVEQACRSILFAKLPCLCSMAACAI